MACKDPLENFALSFKIPIAEGRYTFAVRQYGAGLIPGTVNLMKSGKDGALLVNSLGGPNTKINIDGNFILAIPQAQIVNANNPFEFNIKLGAKGFTSRYFNINTNSKINSSYTALLASKTNTVGGAFGDSVVISNGLAMTKKIINEKGNLLATLDFAQGQQWSNAKGNVNGNLDLMLIHFNNKTYVPGGGTIVNPYNRNGQIQTKAIEMKAFGGMLYLQGANNEGIIATKSNTPIGLKFELANMGTWKLGDSTTVMWYQEETNKWVIWDTRSVKMENGKPIVDVAIDQTGYWALTQLSALCSQGPEFKVSSTYTDHDIVYYYKIEDKKGTVVRSGYLSLNNGNTVRLNYFDEAVGPVRLLLYDYANFRGGDLTKPILTTPFTEICSFSTQTISPVLKTTPEPIEVELVLKCPQGTSIGPDLLKTQIRTQISVPGKNQWQDLLVFTFENPKIKTYKLQKGGVYDFRISTDGGNTWPFLQSNYTIKEQKWSLDVNAEGYCK